MIFLHGDKRERWKEKGRKEREVIGYTYMGIRLTIIINKTLLLAKFSCNIISTTAPAHTHTVRHLIY